MTAIVGDLAVRIGADISDLKRGLSTATKDVGSLSTRIGSGALKFGVYAAAATAAAKALEANLVVRGMKAVNAQAQLAKRLDTSIGSLDVLKRAGVMAGVSMDQIGQASGDLSRRLSQAALSGGPVADALAKIGLSARELQALPLDERIIRINDALNKNADASTRAALAGQLFGEEGSLLMTQLKPEVIAQASKEIEAMGLKLSKVDAARVEQVNAAVGKAALTLGAVVNKYAAELAPAITAVIRLLSESADVGGDMGKKVSEGAGMATTAIGWVVNGVDGLGRVFEVVNRVSETAIRYLVKANLGLADVIVNGPIAAVNGLIALLNKLPGINIEPVGLTGLGEKIRAMADANDQALQKAKIGLSDISAIMDRPWAGDRFKQYVAEAKTAAEEAAKASQAVTGGGGGGETEEQKKLREARERALAAESQYIADRLEAVREGNLTELQLLQDKQMQEIEAINAGWEQKLLTDESWNVLMQETKARHEDEMTALEKKGADARQKIIDEENKRRWDAAKNALGNLSTLMNTENRKMFEVGKAAAIANTLINTKEAAMAAYKAMAGIPIVGPSLGAAAAAAAVASGMAQVSSIRSQSFGGGGAGATATGSNTAAVNAASTPVGGGGGGPAGGTLTVQGLSASSLFSGDAVAALAEELLNYQRRGGQVVFAG